jgi:hypothetical protein
MKKKLQPHIFALSALVLASLACQFVNNLTGAKVSTPTTQVIANTEKPSPTQQLPTADVMSQAIRQWAASATASSEYGTVSWTAKQATGEPDVPDCGDNSLAWAPFNDDTLEWIELTYDIPVVPSEINIYQSYNPSQVVEVDVISTSGTTYTVWQGDAEALSYCPDVMSITIDLQETVTINKVVVVIDQSILGLGWNEIDAVELVGK